MVGLDRDYIKTIRRTLPDTPHDHRQLLKHIDTPADQSGDNDGTTDDDLEPSGLSIDGDEAGSLLAVSIGQAQTHMRSPYTPAFEKSQALEESRDYFDVDLSSEDRSNASAPYNIRQDGHPGNSKGLYGLPSPWVSQPERSRRSSITQAIFGSHQTEGRLRASSGSAGMLGNIRRMFADLPSYSGLASSTEPEENGSSANAESSSSIANSGINGQHSQVAAQYFPSSKYGTGLDGATISSEEDNFRPKALRRTTSDNSLYLRRAATGASDFDDTTNFANVVDYQNPRFKAITDSLADSSFRMPKMPNISFTNSRNIPMRTNSEATAQNTKLNTGQRQRNSPLGDDNIGSQKTPVNEKHPVFTAALESLIGDVVFMGGYRGSVLRSAEFPYQQLWVPVKVGLGIRKVDLEVGLTHEDEERMEEKIIPSGILANIGPIDIARRMIKKVRKSPNAKANQLRVHDWGYDWRLSPHYLSQKLIKFLEDLECNHPETPLAKRGAIVVAHSLGGLITRHAVNQRPELFAGVIFAGTPQNCANILGPLRNGDDVLLSSKVLTAQVNFTLRTSFALLPENGRCFMNKTTNERYDIDFFDINSWDEYHLSPCIRPALPPYTQPSKGIVESITDTISSFTPSLPGGTRSSWFSSSTMGNDAGANSTTEAVKKKAEDTKEDIESATQNAADHIQPLTQEAQGSLEPSMKSSHSKPSVATAVTIPKDKAREYLIRTLAEVKQFKAELHHVQAHEDANRYPPHAIIYGKTVPTVYGAKVASREAIKCSDCFDNLAFAAGDGVILASAAQIPVGYRCVKGGRVQSDRGHIGLLGDLEGLGKCLAAVIEGRKRGIGFGALPDRG